jgi:hypothetical protein
VGFIFGGATSVFSNLSIVQVCGCLFVDFFGLLTLEFFDSQNPIIKVKKLKRLSGASVGTLHPDT